MSSYVCASMLLTQLQVIVEKLWVPKQPIDATQRHGLLGRLKDGEHTVSYCCLIYISMFSFQHNQTNSCWVLLFTCYMSNLIVPEVLRRKDLAVVFLNTNAYPNLDFSSTEQNDKYTIAILRAIFHSCFSFSVILSN